VKKSPVKDYEEEKRPNGIEGNGQHFNEAINQLTSDVVNNINALENDKPLDFYGVPTNNSKPLVGKVVNNNEHDYVYGLEDSNDLDNGNYVPENSPKPNFSNLPNGAGKNGRKMSKQKSRKKVFCNNGKNMLKKDDEQTKKLGFGPSSQKPTSGAKVVLEGKGLNGVIDLQPPKRINIDLSHAKNGAPSGISLLTEEGLRNFERELNDNSHETSTLQSECTASFYEVPVDKPLGLNLEKFLNNVGNGITSTQNYGTMGMAPPIEVQRKVMEDIIKSNKTMLSVINSNRIHLDNVKVN
jgi:hypothetical protein